ncbi:MAG: hypothetical protein FWG73_05950 [Planctomycetaceae bacterium]|nr:hypothetical protein [Planctomycetaceae bacterium]
MQKIKTFTILLLSLILVGCGEQGPDTHHVEGIITQNGQPLGEAMVAFHPAPGGENTRTAVGVSGADGKYTLTADTGLTGRGAFAGDYIVTVQKMEMVAAAAPPSDPSGPPAPTTRYNRVTPQIYSAPNTTPFRATVNPGRNEFDFDMTGR